MGMHRWSGVGGVESGDRQVEYVEGERVETSVGWERERLEIDRSGRGGDWGGEWR